MKQLAAPPVVFTEKQKHALISLLGDEDPQVYEVIRAKLIGLGSDSINCLKPYCISDDALLRKRAIEIIEYFEKQKADTEFLRFCLTQGEEFDLEEATLLLARTAMPATNIMAYGALLDQFAHTLKERLQGCADAERILAVINEYLFGELGFKGNEANYYAPENSYLNQVIDRRTGNPISLCALYIFLGKRLKLPIIGIGLPGHFICRYQSTTEEYYIDAFNLGKLLTKNDCIKYLVHTNHTLQEGFLLPMSTRRMLMRMCANLHQIYTERKQREETERFQRYLVALAK